MKQKTKKKKKKEKQDLKYLFYEIIGTNTLSAGSKGLGQMIVFGLPAIDLRFRALSPITQAARGAENVEKNSGEERAVWKAGLGSSSSLQAV